MQFELYFYRANIDDYVIIKQLICTLLEDFQLQELHCFFIGHIYYKKIMCGFKYVRYIITFNNKVSNLEKCALISLRLAKLK